VGQATYMIFAQLSNLRIKHSKCSLAACTMELKSEPHRSILAVVMHASIGHMYV